MSMYGFVSDDAGQNCIANIVDGKPKLLPSSSDFPVINASTDNIVHYGQTATLDVLNSAIASSAATFKTYRKTPVHERRRLLLHTADLFEARKVDAINRQISETNCSSAWAAEGVAIAVAFLREAASSMTSVLEGTIGTSNSGRTNLIYKTPLGVALIISPWNAALALSVRGIANALAAGCTVVFKASELCPWSHNLVVQTFLDAGFPSGSLNMVMADRENAGWATETLIAHSDVRKIEFIGSAAVGKIIATLAGKYLKPVVMELGDQSPAIVLEDADILDAASKLAIGVTVHHGQVCFSTSRILVHESILEEFHGYLSQATKNIHLDGGYGTKAAADKIKSRIEDAIKEGATQDGSILLNVSKKSALFHEEPFAPIVLLSTFKDDEHALIQANSQTGGLSASIFTSDYRRALRLAQELDFGGVHINNHTSFAEPSGPVTGVKGSGWGSNNGKYGIHEWLYNKAVSLVL